MTNVEIRISNIPHNKDAWSRLISGATIKTSPHVNNETDKTTYGIFLGLLYELSKKYKRIEGILETTRRIPIRSESKDVWEKP